MYDYTKLLARILKLYKSRTHFAAEFGCTVQTLLNKLRNRQPWNQYDIERCCKMLEIRREEIPEYFFALDNAQEERN